MTETNRPDPTEPADAGGEDATRPDRDESFLAPGDAGDHEASGEDDGSADVAPVPPPPD